ncbi:hypothetical protein [Paenibacillus sp. RUD330]|uniref:hypothetical protein n=1 Tax=Paenibacillus sp. RUD330 TaxID=2023772 RepID=UPI000B92D8D1|nr:hypothetical protein [Paenibacillus sp. RUD330]ASS64689.1 hypothetical protein CIC07_00140 [Paenibacillus sp. RUD330]ASS66541.1 hypothetical protein CIC07_10510 [Paenibacillus sp. RUD330]
MDETQLDATERIAQMAEKYGLSLILMLILLGVVLAFLWMLTSGRLVPRSLLDKAEEDRDRLQDILDNERAGMMGPLLDVVKSYKKDEGKGG